MIRELISIVWAAVLFVLWQNVAVAQGFSCGSVAAGGASGGFSVSGSSATGGFQFSLGATSSYAESLGTSTGWRGSTGGGHFVPRQYSVSEGFTDMSLGKSVDWCGSTGGWPRLPWRNGPLGEVVDFGRYSCCGNTDGGRRLPRITYVRPDGTWVIFGENTNWRGSPVGLTVAPPGRELPVEPPNGPKPAPHIDPRFVDTRSSARSPEVDHERKDKKAPDRAPPKPETPKPEPPKSDPPKNDAPKSDPPKTDGHKDDPPKNDSPKTELPKQAAPMTYPPKFDSVKAHEEACTDAKLNAAASCFSAVYGCATITTGVGLGLCIYSTPYCLKNISDATQSCTGDSQTKDNPPRWQRSTPEQHFPGNAADRGFRSAARWDNDAVRPLSAGAMGHWQLPIGVGFDKSVSQYSVGPTRTLLGQFQSNWQPPVVQDQFGRTNLRNEMSGSLDWKPVVGVSSLQFALMHDGGLQLVVESLRYGFDIKSNLRPLTMFDELNSTNSLSNYRIEQTQCFEFNPILRPARSQGQIAPTGVPVFLRGSTTTGVMDIF